MRLPTGRGLPNHPAMYRPQISNHAIEGVMHELTKDFPIVRIKIQLCI